MVFGKSITALQVRIGEFHTPMRSSTTQAGKELVNHKIWLKSVTVQFSKWKINYIPKCILMYINFHPKTVDRLAENKNLMTVS